ncbi:MAG: DUF3459 domain-containing protein, partial [Tepidiformaceae bacterium]
WQAYVYCLQNHDQVGNRPFGERMNAMASRADMLTATMLLLLLPHTPLLFQGQEYLASTPFLFFTDHPTTLATEVTVGRRRDFAQFKAFEDESLRESIPDPQDPLTFARSRLDRDEARFGLGLLAVDFHRQLLHIRATDPVLRAYREQRLPIEAKTVSQAGVLRFTAGGGRGWLVVNFGGEVAFCVDDTQGGEILLHTNEGRFGGIGGAPHLVDGRLTVPASCALWMTGKP